MSRTTVKGPPFAVISCRHPVAHLTGMGTFLQMYSHTASTLYLSWAEMGTTGAPSAMVLCMKVSMASCWASAAASEIRSILFCSQVGPAGQQQMCRQPQLPRQR